MNCDVVYMGWRGSEMGEGGREFSSGFGRVRVRLLEMQGEEQTVCEFGVGGGGCCRKGVLEREQKWSRQVEDEKSDGREN